MADDVISGGAPKSAHQPLFVSHVAEDRKPALEIVRKLEQSGIECWIAPRNIQPGKPYDDEIVAAIEACRAMLLIFSKRCNGNDYIRREMTLAGEAHKLIIPFRIANDEPQGGLRARLVDLHRIDAFDDQDAAIQDLMDALDRHQPETATGHETDTDESTTTGAEKQEERGAEKQEQKRQEQREQKPDEKRGRKRFWLYGAIGAGGVIAATVAALAWLGIFARLPPVPEWTFTGDTFIGKPIPFQWKIDRSALAAWRAHFADADILYELQSAGDAKFGTDFRPENFAENERKDIGRSNASRFWRVSAVAVDGKTRKPLPDSHRAWSRVVQITQYDSAYQRITTTGRVLVYVSKSDNQDIFKWLDSKGGYKGYDIGLARAVVMELSARMRRPLEMVTKGVAWEDLLRAPSRGQADVIISSITKLARREPQYSLTFSDAYFCTSYALVYRAGERDQPIREMIRDRMVGFQTGTTGEDVTNALSKDTPFKMKGYETTELIIQAVVAKEIDLGITDTPFAEAAQLEYRFDGKEGVGYKTFKAADLPASIPPIQEYALAVPAGENDLLGVINGLMQSMKDLKKMRSLLEAAANEYEDDHGLKRGSRADRRERPWECAQ